MAPARRRRSAQPTQPQDLFASLTPPPRRYCGVIRGRAVEAALGTEPSKDSCAESDNVMPSGQCGQARTVWSRRPRRLARTLGASGARAARRACRLSHASGRLLERHFKCTAESLFGHRTPTAAASPSSPSRRGTSLGGASANGTRRVDPLVRECSFMTTWTIGEYMEYLDSEHAADLVEREKRKVG